MRHLFVVTYGRSGSTVLQNVLNTIPGYCIRGENGGMVTSLVDGCLALERARSGLRRADRTQRDPWFGIQEADPDAFRKGLADLFVQTVLRPPPDCRTIGFKEVRYTPDNLGDDLFGEVTDFLLSKFEDARIVFNTRDAAEVAHSGWWAKRPADKVIPLIEHTNMRFAEAHARNPDSTFLIDYADYDGQPEGLVRLLDWLGEKLPPDQLARATNDRLTHMQPAAAKLRGRISRLFRR